MQAGKPCAVSTTDDVFWQKQCMRIISSADCKLTAWAFYSRKVRLPPQENKWTHPCIIPDHGGGYRLARLSIPSDYGSFNGTAGMAAVEQRSAWGLALLFALYYSLVTRRLLSSFSWTVEQRCFSPRQSRDGLPFESRCIYHSSFQKADPLLRFGVRLLDASVSQCILPAI